MSVENLIEKRYSADNGKVLNIFPFFGFYSGKLIETPGNMTCGEVFLK